MAGGRLKGLTFDSSVVERFVAFVGLTGGRPKGLTLDSSVVGRLVVVDLIGFFSDIDNFSESLVKDTRFDT